MRRWSERARFIIHSEMLHVVVLFLYLVGAMALPQPEFRMVHSVWLWGALKMCMAIVLFGRLLMAWRPSLSHHILTMTLAGIFLAFRIVPGMYLTTLLSISIPAALVASLYILPLKNEGHMNKTLVGVTVFLPFLMHYVLPPLNVWPTHRQLILVSIFNFLMLARYAKEEGSLSASNAIRGMLAGFFVLGPVHPKVTSVRRLDFSRSTQGLFLLAFSGVLFFQAGALSERKIAWAPLRALLGGEILNAFGMSLLTWFFRFGSILAGFLLVYGVYLILGLKAPAPVDKIWIASSPLEYWKRANTYRYEMFSYAFGFRHSAFFHKHPFLSVLVVFALSSFHNGAREYTVEHFLRWAIDGAVTASFVSWHLRGSRRRVERYVFGKEGDSFYVRRVSWLRRAVGTVLMLSLHGFLYDLDFFYKR